MKNVLIIGGAGFIGASIVRKLVETSNCSVFVLEPERANIDRLKGVIITLLHTDVKNQVEIYNCLLQNHIDTIVHLASTLIPSSTLFEFQNELNDIVIPTFNLMKMAAELKIKFVYFSSGGTIYGNKSTGIFKESDSLEPICYYGLCKLIIEQAILFEKRTSGLQYLILRPSNPYGPGQNLYGRQGLIAVSIGKIKRNEPVEVWGDGSIIRDYIYIDDLAEITCRLLMKGVEGQIINVGSGVGHSVNEVILCLQNHFPSFDVQYFPGRLVDVPAMILDTQKLSMFCPFTSISLDEGISCFVKKIEERK